MICPNDGQRLSCMDTRQREGYVSRNYRCSYCGERFVSAEFFREKQVGGRKSRMVQGDSFGAAQIREIKATIADKLRSVLDDLEKS